MEEKRNELPHYKAARWFARLHAHDCTKSDREEFERWLHSSPENADAYRKAELLATKMSAASQQDPRFAELANSALVPAGSSSMSRWRVAAAVLVGIAIAAFGLVNRSPFDAGVVVVNHSNLTRQQQRYVLDDGSVVTLDVGSRLSFRMSSKRRSVDLLAGRAYFEVAHDESRPFIVNAGSLRTTDVGTRFQVALATNEVSVTLVEGAVMVSDENGGSKLHDMLRPGEEVLWKAGSAALEKRAVDANALTSWSTGRLIFKGTPLATVLDEVNRYSDCKIRLGDAGLASIPIGGNFIAGGDSTQVIDALAAVLPLRVVRVGPKEIVLFQRNES